MLRVYGIKNCGSVKKALNFFKDHDIAYDFFDLKNESLDCKKITSWLEYVDIKLLLNSRGATYRNLKLKELNLDDIAKQRYLCEHNMLIKRPVIEYNNKIIVGFNLTDYEGVFL